MFSEANAGTDAVVRSGTEVGDSDVSERGLLDASIVDDIAAVDGVATAVPEIYGIGQIVGSDGDPLGGNGPPTQAGNWIADPEINPWRIADGRAPRGRPRWSSTRPRPTRVIWRWVTPRPSALPSPST